MSGLRLTFRPARHRLELLQLNLLKYQCSSSFRLAISGPEALEFPPRSNFSGWIPGVTGGEVGYPSKRTPHPSAHWALGLHSTPTCTKGGLVPSAQVHDGIGVHRSSVDRRLRVHRGTDRRFRFL